MSFVCTKAFVGVNIILYSLPECTRKYLFSKCVSLCTSSVSNFIAYNYLISLSNYNYVKTHPNNQREKRVLTISFRNARVVICYCVDVTYLSKIHQIKLNSPPRNKFGITTSGKSHVLLKTIESDGDYTLMNLVKVLIRIVVLNLKILT